MTKPAWPTVKPSFLMCALAQVAVPSSNHIRQKPASAVRISPRLLAMTLNPPKKDLSPALTVPLDRMKSKTIMPAVIVSNPTDLKAPCQPTSAFNEGTKRFVSKIPPDGAARKMPKAVPRSRAGNHSMMAKVHEENTAPAPKPAIIRSINPVSYVVMNPKAQVDKPSSNKLMPKMNLTPKRSANTPAGICVTTYPM